MLSGPIRADEEADDEEADDEDDAYAPDSYGTTGGLVYEAPDAGPGQGEQLTREHAESEQAPNEPGKPRPVRNDGLGIFGDVATTAVPDDEAPEAGGERHRPAPPRPESPPAHVVPIGVTWNQTTASPAVAGSTPEERKPNRFERIRGMRLGGGQPDDDEPMPSVSVRDLPPDVQMSFIRDRVIIVLVVGVLSFILFRLWPLSVTLMIVAWVLDMIRRSRSAALYVNGGRYPGARKETAKQLRKMRGDGYYTLDSRPIPGSPEVIDHLVIGPTGVYAIDSEKWNPKLPIRTWNNKKLYHGPESQKERLEHAVWEASQASELLSSALGTDVKVRPALAIYGPKIPWDIATIRNVDVFTGSALRKYLKARGRMKDIATRLSSEEAKKIYNTATQVLPSVAPEKTYTPVG